MPSTIITNAIPPTFDNHRMLPGNRPAQYRRHPRTYTAEDYLQLCTFALKYREPYAQRWRMMEALYDNMVPTTDDPWERPAKLGKATSVVHTIVSTLFNRNPKNFVDPFEPEEYDQAVLLEALANNEWTFGGVYAREMLNCVIDTSIYGISGMVTCYEADFEKVLRASKKRMQLVDESIRSETIDEYVMERMKDVDADLHAPPLELSYLYDERVKREKVASFRVSPWDLVPDPCGPIQEQMGFLFRRIYVPFHAIEEGPFENLEGLSPDREFDDKFWPKGPDKMVEGELDFREWTTVLQGIDLRADRLITIAPNHPKFLQNIKNPYAFPTMRLLSWNNRGERVYPRSDLEVVAPLIQEAEILRTKLRAALEREQIDVYLADENVGMGEEQLVTKTLPDDSIIIPVARGAGDTTPINAFITKLQRDPKTVSIFQHLMMIAQEIQEAIGLGPNQLGSAMKSGTTASEAMEVAGSSRNKSEYKFRAVERFAGDVACDRLSVYAQFYDERKIKRVVGRAAAQQWAAISFSKGDIQGRFSVNVEEGSMAPPSDQARQALWMNFVRMFGMIPGMEQVASFPAALKRMLQAFGVRDGDPVIIQNDPQQAAAALATQRALSGPGKGGAGGGGQGTSPAGGNQAAMGAVLGGAA